MTDIKNIVITWPHKLNIIFSNVKYEEELEIFESNLFHSQPTIIPFRSYHSRPTSYFNCLADIIN